MKAAAVDLDERWWQVLGTVLGTGGRRMSGTRSLPTLDLVCFIPIVCQILCQVFYVPYLI